MNKPLTTYITSALVMLSLQLTSIEARADSTVTRSPRRTVLVTKNLNGDQWSIAAAIGESGRILDSTGVVTRPDGSSGFVACQVRDDTDDGCKVVSSSTDENCKVRFSCRVSSACQSYALDCPEAWSGTGGELSSPQSVVEPVVIDAGFFLPNQSGTQSTFSAKRIEEAVVAAADDLRFAHLSPDRRTFLIDYFHRNPDASRDEHWAIAMVLNDKVVDGVVDKGFTAILTGNAYLSDSARALFFRCESSPDISARTLLRRSNDSQSIIEFNCDVASSCDGSFDGCQETFGRAANNPIQFRSKFLLPPRGYTRGDCAQAGPGIDCPEDADTTPQSVTGRAQEDDCGDCADWEILDCGKAISGQSMRDAIECACRLPVSDPEFDDCRACSRGASAGDECTIRFREAGSILHTFVGRCQPVNSVGRLECTSLDAPPLDSCGGVDETPCDPGFCCAPNAVGECATGTCEGLCVEDVGGQPNVCDAYQEARRCGNGRIEGSEECDGEAPIPADACSRLDPRLDGQASCTTACKYNPSTCTGCGNGRRESLESCDGADVAGQTCASLGYAGGGTLGCGRECFFDESACLQSDPSLCANGSLDPGEACDDGARTGTAGSCCAAGCHGPAPAGGTCRPAAGQCDVAETCDGVSGACPTDAFAASGAACPDDGNLCTRDLCTGTSAACQHPAGNPGVVCRAASGECDLAETCDGSSAGCPGDAAKPASTACADDGSLCTRDVCDGSSKSCTHPAGNAGVTCGPPTETCGVSAVCNGTSTTCPSPVAGQIGPQKQCNGTNFGGATCSSRSFDGGTLSCSSTCTIVDTSCYRDYEGPNGQVISSGTAVNNGSSPFATDWTAKVRARITGAGAGCVEFESLTRTVSFQGSIPTFRDTLTAPLGQFGFSFTCGIAPPASPGPCGTWTMQGSLSGNSSSASGPFQTNLSGVAGWSESTSGTIQLTRSAGAGPATCSNQALAFDGSSPEGEASESPSSAGPPKARAGRLMSIP